VVMSARCQKQRKKCYQPLIGIKRACIRERNY